jgi:uncharacterized Ntn-hydrolase superfamily protein
MRSGKSATDALAALVAVDAGRDVRQVAMVDAHGDVAAHTGSKCIQGAGQIVGRQYSVQANLMLNDRVWPAMAKAYEGGTGDLADRLLAALDAAQLAGGDIRGKQSAAILIVKGTSTGRVWADRLMELRVEDHAEPLVELRRLVQLHKAYDHMNRGDLAVEHGDMDAALIEYGAAQEMVPDNVEMKFWTAVSLAHGGRVDEALPLFRTVFVQDMNWATLVQRLPASGVLPDDTLLIRRILSVVPKHK